MDEGEFERWSADFSNSLAPLRQRLVAIRRDAAERRIRMRDKRPRPSADVAVPEALKAILVALDAMHAFVLSSDVVQRKTVLQARGEAGFGRQSLYVGVIALALAMAALLGVTGWAAMPLIGIATLTLLRIGRLTRLLSRLADGDEEVERALDAALDDRLRALKSFSAQNAALRQDLTEIARHKRGS